MEEKEKNSKLLISIIVIILVIIVAYFIYSTYRKNIEKTDEIVTPVTTEEGYLQINTTGNNKERASINKVNKDRKSVV